MSVALVLGPVLLASFAVSRIRRRAPGWALVLLALVASEWATAASPPVVRMLAISSALLLALKGVVSVEEPELPAWKWFAFTLGYPGMRPSAFATLGGPPREGALALLLRGLARLLLGLGLVALGRAVFAVSRSEIAASLLVLPGLSLVLHFGLFNLAAGFFRLLGADTDAIFKAPLLARSLGEFWSRRWNLAFSEMTASCVYRPLRGVFGRRTALLASFVFSGLLHEAAISVPVHAGYGFPLGYFVLQGVLVASERARSPVPGRVWTLFWLGAPLLLLFHPPFLRGVVFPLVFFSPGGASSP